MFVGGVVVAVDAQLLAGVCLGDLLEEAQEILVAVVADVGDLADGGLERGGAVEVVAMGLALGNPDSIASIGAV
jgi:hypothetical protein